MRELEKVVVLKHVLISNRITFGNLEELRAILCSVSIHFSSFLVTSFSLCDTFCSLDKYSFSLFLSDCSFVETSFSLLVTFVSLSSNSLNLCSIRLKTVKKEEN